MSIPPSGVLVITTFFWSGEATTLAAAFLFTTDGGGMAKSNLTVYLFVLMVSDYSHCKLSIICLV